MRLFSIELVGGDISAGDALALLAPPFDITGVAGVRTFRPVITDAWQGGPIDGLVWPWSILPGRTPTRMTKPIIQGSVDEDADCAILAYCLTLGGVPITRAGIASMAFSVFDTFTATAVDGYDWADVAVSSVVPSEPQTQALDPRWNRTSGGANFIHELPAEAFPLSDRRYAYQCRAIEAGSGQTWYVRADVWARSVARS